jgi:hypothetical protein
VFGSTAYVHIQKDQRHGLSSHIKKCVFLGYPQEYPGWLFWHPETKKEVISDRTDFDERYFLGNTTKIPDATPTPAPVPSVYTPLPLAQDHGVASAPRTLTGNLGTTLVGPRSRAAGSVRTSIKWPIVP